LIVLTFFQYLPYSPSEFNTLVNVLKFILSALFLLIFCITVGDTPAFRANALTVFATVYNIYPIGYTLMEIYIGMGRTIVSEDGRFEWDEYNDYFKKANP